MDRQFPNWEQLYQEQAVESMPWFHEALDPDLERALHQLNITQGTALDIGTGPGTQAIALARLGFRVTATDLSTTAIEKAKEKTQDARLDILWMQDDILNSQLDGQFSVIVDRGCFHVLPPQQRQDYVSVVASLLEPSGYLFLKCFSTQETRESGPYRFTANEIEAIFQSHFHLISSEETQYYGTLDPMPKALFCILGKLKRDRL
jgi:2-polyprenyl-3-methyl-5-hydroxy-6-metoxy-1,4-benzoquinol methylase